MENLKLILNSYKISTSPKEISDILTKGHEEGHAFMWQSYPDHRILFDIETFKLEANNQRIKINYIITKEAVNKDVPLYIKLPFRETIFKGKVVEFAQNIITVEIPTEVHLRDFREGLRTAFKLGEKFAFIRPLFMGVKDIKLATLKVNLRDVSQKGLGIYISESNVHNFRPGQLLELVGFEANEFSTPVLGKVVWNCRADGYHEKGLGYRLGIQLLSPLAELVITKLSIAFEKSSPSEALLKLNVFSDEFREKLNREVTKTLEKMMNNPSLSKYLNSLRLSREHDDYITEHIKVLSIICTFMARSMKWGSEASLEKFIYTAFLHDAPLFEYPHLAKIKCLNEFELLKGEFTLEEREVFLLAPEIASNLALKDPDAPSEVGQMLLNQKELPNGQGIYKKNYTKIPPLAALFIVAHDLTDEIMSNPKWSIDKWFQRAVKTYTGGHFDKIMDTMKTAKVSFTHNTNR